MVNKTQASFTPLQDYYDALNRLIESGERINFDSVALEAGRKRGAIKGNNDEIIQLKKGILEAKDNQNSKQVKKSPQHKLHESNRIKENYKVKYHQQVAINHSLMNDLCNVVFELAELKLEMEEILKSKNNILEFTQPNKKI